MIIYLIKNIINNKIYVGQTTVSINRRFYCHCKYGKGIIGEAIKKYGKEKFIIEEIEICNSIEQLNEREIYWIAFYNCIAPNGYNLAGGGLNKIMHESTKEKLSKLKTGQKHSEETKKKLSEIGKTKTGENNNAFGYKFTDEQRKKQSELNKGNTNRRGKKLSEETKIKISNSLKNKI